MVSPRIHFSVCFVLVYQFTVAALPASKNFTVVKLFPPPSQQNDADGGLVPQEIGKGVMADQRSAFLGKNADSFRFHRPGFEHVPGSVSLESAAHPGLYLRYKNYKFHLEKAKPTGVFEKDATYIERKTQTKGAAAYELFNHPGWFMCHDTTSKFGLVARKIEIKSHDFLMGCLYMAVAQKPTKQDLQKLKLSDVKNESADNKQSIPNFSDIISNDVSAENLMKDLPEESPPDKLALQMDNQINKTNDQQLFGKSNATAKYDKLSSNSTAGKNSSSAKTMDQASDSESVKNSTKQTSDLKSSDQLHDSKASNVTELNAHVTNVTQKPKIELQNKMGMLAAHEGKQQLQNNKKVMDFAANNTQNSSKLSGNTNEGKQVAKQEQTNPDAESANVGSAAANQTAHNGLGTAPKLLNGGFGKGIASAAVKPNLQFKGNTLALQKKPNGLPLPFVPKQAANAANMNNTQPKKFNLHFEFQNDKPYSNGTLANGKPPNTLPTQLAKVTAKALGFIQHAFRNQQRQKQQMSPKFAKVGAVFPFQQQQQQQQFRRPMNYVNQQMLPQAIFNTPPNYINAPAPIAPGRPLLNQFGVKGPHSQFAYPQFKPMAPQPLVNNRFGYQFPVKGWGGLVSVGKQSLMGNSAKFHDRVQNKTHVQEKSKAKLEDDMPSKISEENDKCISLKFINKVRKPIKLVTSMKLEGYLITAETFKLKTVFKHPRKHHHVIFYARDADDRDNEVLLNNNNAIAVTPGGCDLPFRSVLLSHHGQIANKEIEHIREDDEYNASMEAARKAVHGKGDENFTQWTAFGSCTATCGRSLQTRTRSCKPGTVCKGQSAESRTCIQTPCPVSTCLKTYSGKCCALPFVYRGAVTNRCLVDPHSRRSWCATTPNFDKEKRWGYCQPADPHTEQVAPVIRSFLPASPGQSTCLKACARICMSWCPKSCCVPAGQR